MKAVVIDALTLGDGRRELTRDFIGAGPRMVAATLRASNIDTRICRGEDFLKTKSMLDADACFISGMTMDRPSIIQIAKTWHAVRDNAPVIVGGPVSLEPEILLKYYEIDAVFQGECEYLLFTVFSRIKATQGLDFEAKNLDGFLTRKNLANYVRADIKPDISWIEKNIDPAIDCLKYYDNSWAARVYIELLRGCSNFSRARLDCDGNYICKDCGYCDTCGEYQIDSSCAANIPVGCGFCSTASTSGPVRSFSTDYVIKQVEESIKLGCHRIVLGGSDILEYHREKYFKAGQTRPEMPPGPNHDALNELVTRLLDNKEIKNGCVQITAENIKANLCDEESLSIISRIPGISVSIGVETGSDEHLRNIGKSTTIERIKQAIQLLNKHQIRYHAYFIHSLPGQTSRIVQESVNLMRWLDEKNAEKITIYRFKPLPATAFWRGRVSKYALDESEPMVTEAIRINEARKEKYVGNVFKILIAEQDFRDKSAAIAYMLQGGPKVKLKNCRHLVGDKKIHVARIVSVISDKMTEAVLVD